MDQEKRIETAHLPSNSQNCFGPALPPSMNQSDSSISSGRESWMQDSSSLDFLASNTYSKKEVEKKREKTPEYDYSAPGLHVMKKSSKNNRLFSRHKENTSTHESKSELDKMKARFKKKNYDEQKCTDDKNHSKSSHFRAPTDRGYSDPNRKRCARSRSKSPRRSSSSQHETGHSNRRRRSRSPLKEKKRRSRSRSPKSKTRNHSKSRSPDREQKQVYKSQIPELTSGGKEGTNNRCKDKDMPEESNASSTPQKTTNSSNVTPSDEKKVTSDDLNKLSAKILKAEIVGNSEKATKLGIKLEEMKKLLKAQSMNKPSVKEEVVILTKTDSKGNVRPVDIESDALTDRGKKRKKEKIAKTHDAAGLRDKYFPDDKNRNLSDLLQEEKSINKLGQDQLFMKYAGKLSKMSSDRQNWTIDDMFESNIAKEKSSGTKDADRIKSQGQQEHKRLQSCHMCLEKCSKDSIVYIGKTLYVRVPLYKSLSTYQCQIIPVNHIIASVNGDEDFWDELKIIKSSITKKFASKKLDTVFLESAQRLGQRRHIFIDCVPVPEEDGALLPAYFKKAILDCDVEWAQNKKLVDTRKKSLRKSVPQGLPYFSVEFGTDGGFAHVIEEESLFKRYFGLEVLGGVIDCDVNLWRNPEKETFEGLRYKKKTFEKLSIEFE